MLPLLLTWLCLLLDLFLSVCTSVSGRVSLVCRLSLSNTRRRGEGSLHGTSFPSDWNQIDQPYQFTLQEQVPGLRGDHTRSLVSVNLQKQPTEGSNFSENLLTWACGVTHKHAHMHLFILCQPHLLLHVGEQCNISSLLRWRLRQSDWPRLLKMDLEHLPFIAFPLPLPDVTAEHDFPRKKKKRFCCPFRRAEQ